VTEYQDLLERAYQAKGYKLDLSTVHQLMQALGNPEKAFHSIHVGGTNGKGSVATKIAKALQSSGVRVALYTSPHLRHFEERIRINGECISKEDVRRGLREIAQICDERELTPTFFEITTALAFRYFAMQSIDVAVVEVGLGGRLDATNVIRPLLAIITSIGLDHMEYLGYTKEQIAREKAGIAKKGVPLLLGPTVQQFGFEGVHVKGGAKDYLEENEMIAREALCLLRQHFPISDDAFEEGIKALPPCRFEWKDRFLFDVAHNVDGIASLGRALRSRYPNDPFCMFLGLAEGRNPDDLLHAARATGYPVTPVYADHPMLQKTPDCMSLEEALKREWDEHPVICGSCYLVGEALAILDPQEAGRVSTWSETERLFSPVLR